VKEIGFLSGELKALKEGIENIQAFSSKPEADYGKFGSMMKDFLPTSTALIGKIEGLFGKAQGLYNDLLTFFGENDASVTRSFADFFGVILSFSIVFEKTYTDIERKKLIEEKHRQAAAERERRELLRLESPNQGKANRLKRALTILHLVIRFPWQPTKLERRQGK